MKEKKSYVPIFKRPYLNIKNINVGFNSVIEKIFILFILIVIIYIFYRQYAFQIFGAAFDLITFIFSLDFLPTNIPTEVSTIDSTMDLIQYKKNIIFNSGKIVIWAMLVLFLLVFLFKNPSMKEEALSK